MDLVVGGGFEFTDSACFTTVVAVEVYEKEGSSKVFTGYNITSYLQSNSGGSSGGIPNAKTSVKTTTTAATTLKRKKKPKTGPITSPTEVIEKPKTGPITSPTEVIEKPKTGPITSPTEVIEKPKSESPVITPPTTTLPQAVSEESKNNDEMLAELESLPEAIKILLGGETRFKQEDSRSVS